MGQQKKILIVSDTHRKNDNYFALLERLGPLYMVIHCGDAEGSEYAISQAAVNQTADCLVHIVPGNNDFFHIAQGTGIGDRPLSCVGDPRAYLLRVHGP